MTHIICPGCESVVRELDDAPCPNCRRCPLCGRKLKKDEDHCGPHPGADFGRYFSELVIAEKDVPRERRRMEIREQLELKKWLALAIPFGVWFGMQPMIRGVLFRELTFANVAGSACVFGSVVMITFMIVSRIFPRIENRRLQAEFPSEPSSDNDSRNDVAQR